ncbi:MAG: type II toxin-antitoxin system RelE/ParE family toxin [Planctomycetes bacterium]|nr:type II toxin-antitoxin system RelE/ParE family toxin [Planctomycetota bacterium]
MRLETHPDAESELLEAADWYDRHRPGLGDDLVDEVNRWLDVILEAPAAWPLWPGAPTCDPPVRRCLLSRFDRYAIAYQAFSDRVRIVAIAHTSRRPFYWASRARS